MNDYVAAHILEKYKTMARETEGERGKEAKTHHSNPSRRESFFFFHFLVDIRGQLGKESLSLIVDIIH